eukprot:TRINITY_DN10684_c0_g1_i1.p1 TRINITY_DN10684_c0_g1~~TRINITY_DN10684_c0_g1_i1.p1  ORF type:complete len:302 (+),score=36.97 TRINITY_DN10684_c0_g1_i1:33-938(+)
MLRRPQRSTLSSSSAASDVYKRQSMCWSWEVSLVFSALEWAAAAYLLARGRQRDHEYGLFIGTIATMESCQMLLWLAIDYDHDPANKLVSVVLWADAWLAIPLSIVNIVAEPSQASWTPRQRLFGAFFTSLALVMLMCMRFSDTWTTVAGPNHHQIWPCAAALAWLGGHMTCIGLCVFYVIMIAFALKPLRDPELVSFLAIGVVTFTPSYVILGPTMEACSVWCWSAGSYGIYFLLRGTSCLQGESIWCAPFAVGSGVEAVKMGELASETENLTSHPEVRRPGLRPRSRPGSRSESDVDNL